jgi:hypothetical protein
MDVLIRYSAVTSGCPNGIDFGQARGPITKYIEGY